MTTNSDYSSNENVRLLLELAPDAFFQGDKLGNILWANSKAEEMTGYSKEELASLNLKDIFTRESLTAKPLNFTALEQGEVLRRIRQIQRKDGSTLYIEMVSRQMPDGTYQSFVRDIYDRMKAENELRLFKDLVEASTDAVGMSTPEGEHYYQNKTFDTLFGKIGKNPVDTLYVDPNVGKDVFRTIMAGNPWNGEVKMYSSERKILDILLRAFAIKDRDGKTIAVVGIHTDITHRKLYETEVMHAKERAEESERRYKSMVSILPDGVIIHQSGKIVFHNEACGKIMKAKPGATMIGELAINFVHPDYRELAMARIRKSLSENTPAQTIEEVFIDFDGNPINVYVTAMPFIYQGVPSMLTVFTDITSLKDYEKELIHAKEKAEESDHLKSAFLANISHEIRTPMNAIMGFAELLKKPELSHEKASNFISLIHRSGKQLLSIISDIVEISKIETGQIIPHYSEVNLVSLIVNIYESFKVSLPEDKRIKYELESPEIPDTTCIFTDEIKVNQILSNLISNAIKYTESGRITVSCRLTDDKMLALSVEDTGIGIDKKSQSVIFDRFHRLNDDLVTKAGGSGLGLAIARAYTEMIGGRIELESEPGKGSRFTVIIPFQEVEVVQQQFLFSTSDVKPKEYKGKILVAEDDDINYAYITELLEERNLAYIRAKNGTEAVELSGGEDVILVMLDIKMPEINGYEALKQIRTIRPNLPVVAQTAYALANDLVKINDAGFDGILTKPIHRENLFELIDYLLDWQKK